MIESLPLPLGMTMEGFAAEAGRGGMSRAVAREVYRAFHRKAEGGERVPRPVTVLSSDSPEGVVHKFLLPVPVSIRRSGELTVLNGATLETESVVIPMRRRDETTYTLCVSSQVGCAMGCGFCETAQMGLIRSLDASEIAAQWFAARHFLGHDIRNIVFMGMGEPLDNFEQVIGAIESLTDHDGAAIAKRRITISTVGRLDGLARLREVVVRQGWRQLNLAVSINAPNDEIRSGIMPINRAMPLSDLMKVLRDWPVRRSGAICAEYVLIPGVNDADQHADELASLLRGIRCCVNVIPYNPRRDSPWPAPLEEDVVRFMARLETNGQYCKRRRTKGRESMAACGQLGNERVRGRRLIESA